MLAVARLVNRFWSAVLQSNVAKRGAASALANSILHVPVFDQMS
jgi:hypothetical protein